MISILKIKVQRTLMLKQANHSPLQIRSRLIRAMCTSSDLAGVNASVDRATNIDNFVDDNLSVNDGEVMLHDLSASAGQAQSSVQFDSAEQWRSWLKIIVRATFLGGSPPPPPEIYPHPRNAPSKWHFRRFRGWNDVTRQSFNTPQKGEFCLGKIQKNAIWLREVRC
jgi:hypothetical protein